MADGGKWKYAAPKKLQHGSERTKKLCHFPYKRLAKEFITNPKREKNVIRLMCKSKSTDIHRRNTVNRKKQEYNNLNTIYFLN